MHIRSISCSGFKTYRDTVTVVDLHPGINSVVGLNGSGKSSLFQAIIFVLSPAHGGVCSSSTFLHEGSGGKAVAGFAELEIDNSFRIFPIDSDSVTLRRILAGLHRNDEFSVNGKAIQRSEYITLLQTANLAGVNAEGTRRTKCNVIPYYIVEQGRIAATASVSDEERFRLFREAIGLDVFDEKRIESLSILQETDDRRARVNELIQDFNSRCEGLKKESSEMEEYSRLKRERERVEVRIGKIEESHLSGMRERLVSEIQKNSRQIAVHEDELAELEAQHLLLEKDEQDADIQGVYELENSLAKILTDIKFKKTEIQDLFGIIEKSNQNLTQVDELVGPLQAKRRDLAASIEVDKVEIGSARINLNKQQGILSDLHTQLKEIEVRDQSLPERQEELKLVLASAERRAGLVNSAVEEKEEELKILETRLIPDKEVEMRKIQLEVSEEERSTAQNNETRTNLAKEARELNGKIFSMKQKIFEISRESDRLEKDFKDVSGSVLRSSNWNTRDLVSRSDITGVKGLFGEFIRIPPAVRTAVESSSRNVLFQVMIESDKLADEIARKLTGGKGKVTLTPINKLTEEKSSLENDLKKSGLNAQLLSSLISPREDDKEEGEDNTDWVQKAIKKFFSRTVLVDTIDTGVQVAKQFKLDAVSIDGDLVSKDLVVKGGALGGGLASRKFGVVKDWQQALGLKRKIACLKSDHKKLDSQVMVMDQTLKGIESQLGAIAQQPEDISSDENRGRLALVKRELNGLLDRKKELECFELVNLREVDMINARNEVERLTEDLRGIWLRIAGGEQGKKLISESERRARIDCMQKEMQSVEAKIKSLEKIIGSVSKRMNADQAELEHFVSNRLEHLAEVKAERMTEIKHTTAKIDQLQQELQSVELGQLKVAEFQLNERRDSLTKKSPLCEVEFRKQEIDSEKSRIQSELNTLVSIVKLGESKISQLDTDLAECVKNLPLVPVGEEMDVDSDSLRDLRTRIVEINKKLNSNKFAYLNKKSLEQYERFHSEKIDLELRHTELDHSHIALAGFLEDLRVKENRIVSAAFEKIGKSFSEIFSRVVTAGVANLQLNDKKISVHVSFPAGGDAKPTLKRLHELSGGQRTVVAICFLLALSKAAGVATSQGANGTRFFVLDEADAALDANYRSTIAGVLHEESVQGTQVILTSFRPELCAAAHKHWRVSMISGTSIVEAVDINTAMNLVDGDQGGIENIRDEPDSFSARE